MNKFFIIYNESKKGGETLAGKIKARIEEKGGVVAEGKPAEDTECILVLGGDGTFLRAAKDYAAYDLPLMGINIGTLGFLTQASGEDALTAVDRLMEDEYYLSKRTEIVCSYDGLEKSTALNDVVISRGGYSHLVGIMIYINDNLFTAYEGDGLIISTATGSTGYNLSAGGPIMAPGVNALLITPICPHALGVRSFVISGDDKVRIKIRGNRHRVSEPAYVTVDGADYTTLNPDEEIHIAKASSKCKMIMLKSTSFVETLNNKFH